MLARIYQPAPNPMQSGRANTRQWMLEFEPESQQKIEPLMGYTSSADMRQQVRIHFETAEAAVGWCKREGIPYTVFRTAEPRRRKAAYADNFAFTRKSPWTH